MAREVLEARSIDDLLKAASHLVKLPKTHMWLDYDAEVDVLDDGVILDYRGNRLVGLTILEASHR